jgi:DNA repair exonuclease SbcCD ATPase subunit
LTLTDDNLAELVQAKKKLGDQVNKASKFEKMLRTFIEKYQKLEGQLEQALQSNNKIRDDLAELREDNETLSSQVHSLQEQLNREAPRGRSEKRSTKPRHSTLSRELTRISGTEISDDDLPVRCQSSAGCLLSANRRHSDRL